MQPPALRFHHLTKLYGSVRVLRDIDLEIGSGEFFGLVGMNSAGKTTLIKCLLDFCAVDGGTITTVHCVMSVRPPTVAGNMGLTPWSRPT